MIELIAMNSYPGPAWVAPAQVHRPAEARAASSAESALSRTETEFRADSSFRLARLASIREQIEAGTFETPERIDGTVSRLLDVIA